MTQTKNNAEHDIIADPSLAFEPERDFADLIADYNEQLADGTFAGLLPPAFADNPEDEISRLQMELQLPLLMHHLDEIEDIESLRPILKRLVLDMSDLFSDQMPVTTDDISFDLTRAARFLNLSQVLGERGVFLLWRAMNTTGKDKVPSYKKLYNPATMQTFQNRNELIYWFSKEAGGPSRAHIYRRFRTINRLLSLGFAIDEIYSTIITKPSVIDDTLEMLGTWTDDHRFIGVNPEAGIKLIETTMPTVVEEYKELYKKENKNNDDLHLLQNMEKYATKLMIEEVAAHQNASDAKAMVVHDILRRPEISYSFDEKSGTIRVKQVVMVTDEAGNTFVDSVKVFNLMSDTVDGDIPMDTIRDLVRRLPIGNRDEVLNKLTLRP